MPIVNTAGVLSFGDFPKSGCRLHEDPGLLNYEEYDRKYASTFFCVLPHSPGL